MGPDDFSEDEDESGDESGDEEDEGPEIEEIQTEGTKEEAKKKARRKNRRKGGMEVNAEDGSDLLALAPPGSAVNNCIPGLFVFATVFLALSCFKRARGFRRPTRGREPLMQT